MKTILIAEDNDKSRYMLEHLLENTGYNVLTAEDGLDAFECLKKNNVDLIISDILMPQMNGFLLCEKIKKDDKYKHIPFIFYTATFVTDNDEKLALGLGASKFLIKPMDTDDLTKIIENVIKQHENSRLENSKMNIDESLKDLYNFSITKKLDKKVKELNEERLALKRSEQKLKEAQEIANVGHWELDLKNNKMLWSEQLYRIIGLTPKSEEITYDKFLSAINPEERNEIGELFSRLLKDGVPFDKIHSIHLKDSSVRYVHQRGQIQYDDNGLPVYLIGTVHDITENVAAEINNKKKDAIIFQSQKLKSLGEMAAGIIHEINQPLSGMTMAADMIVRYCEDENVSIKDIEKTAKIVIECIQRIGEISNRIRMFSRTQYKQKKSKFYINECIVNVLKIIERILYKNNITIEMELTDDNPQVLGSSNYFEQVILNLINNARDAILEKKENNDKNFIRIETSVNNEGVIILVEDNGKGISEEIKERVFEPFFTTKSEKEGTGLGLSVSYGIILNMSGKIDVESVPGKTTKFIISLPGQVSENCA